MGDPVESQGELDQISQTWGSATQGRYASKRGAHGLSGKVLGRGRTAASMDESSTQVREGLGFWVQPSRNKKSQWFLQKVASPVERGV
jgi:hypothetical protein